MTSHTITRIPFDQFHAQTDGKKLVLLYPWTTYKNAFLSYFLANAAPNFLYYRITEDHSTLFDFVIALATEFSAAYAGFGKQISGLNSSSSPTQLAEALAADLQAAVGTSPILYLDELDRLTFNDKFSKFGLALVDCLPEQGQLVLSGRLASYQPWYNIIARGDGIVLGTEYRKNNVMFEIENTPSPQLEVYALGRGYVFVNGHPVNNWDGTLPRNLFFYLMDHPLVTRDQIFSVFWPELSTKDATNVFHVTKRKISERISAKVEVKGNFELTQYGSGFYTPSDKIIRRYDVDDFQNAVESAMTAATLGQEEELLTQAINLYRAHFLTTVDMPWVDKRRTQLRHLYAQALIARGRIYKNQGNYPGALGLFTRAITETPEREDIHREVIATYLNLGMRDDAQRQYQHLSQILMETLGISPSRESREMLTETAVAS